MGEYCSQQHLFCKKPKDLEIKDMCDLDQLYDHQKKHILWSGKPITDSNKLFYLMNNNQYSLGIFI